MTNFVPIFPLGIIVYPGEKLNLHIFEPRYKQLISECFAQKKPFGIPVVLDNKLQEAGTLVNITEITQTYEDGKMDIKTQGVQVFRILEIIKEIPDKLYSGAIVNYLENTSAGNPVFMQKIISGIKALHKILNTTKDFNKEEKELSCFDLAHHVGFSLQEEYEFLLLTNELQRQEYIKRHLTKVLPLMAQMEYLKEKIKMNGHFKNLESFNF